MKKEIFNQYYAIVCERYNINPDELFGSGRKANVAEARHMLYFLCQRRNMRITFIQQCLDERGVKVAHPNVIHGTRTIQKLVDTDKDYARMVDAITDSVTIS
jgi:chromosomal replication initiation ATPase DnaA